jgi:hypothetical protein
VGPGQELAEERLELPSNIKGVNPDRGPGGIWITSELGRGRTCRTIRPQT